MDVRQRALRVVTQACVALLVLAWISVHLVGCNSPDYQPVAEPETGSFGVTVKWPPRPEGVGTELIPLASNSIKVEISPFGYPASTRTIILNRPDAHATVYGIPAGDAVVWAGAYPLADAQGVLQAEAGQIITILAHHYNESWLQLQSTIVSVAVSPGTATVEVGGTLPLSAAAKNDNGETVLVPAAGGFIWEVTEGAAFASVDSDGVVTGLAEGTAVVRATETASGENNRRSGTATVFVSAAHEDETVGPDGQTLVWVPSGRFMMGNDGGAWYEEPVHEVALDGFWIGQWEVSNERYATFLNAAQPGDVSAWLAILGPDCGIEFVGGVYRAKALLGDYPAADVTWYGAVAYCAQYGYDLPTEAQWEYAAGGPSSLRYAWGDEWDPAKCCNSGNLGPFGGTYPVGSFATGASWCNALDMTGNVAEWCADWWSGDYYQISPTSNPTGPLGGDLKVVRGGSWGEDAYFCRAAVRGNDLPDLASSYQGFRVARSDE